MLLRGFFLPGALLPVVQRLLQQVFYLPVSAAEFICTPGFYFLEYIGVYP